MLASWPLLRGKDCVEAAVCLPTPCGFKLVLTLTVSKHLDVINLIRDARFRSGQTYVLRPCLETNIKWLKALRSLFATPMRSLEKRAPNWWHFGLKLFTWCDHVPCASRGVSPARLGRLNPRWQLLYVRFMCKPRLSLADMLLACFYFVSPVLPSFFKLSKPPLWRAG